MTRTEHLRSSLGWSQAKLASHLRLAQSAVARMEAGQQESGPVSLLLDQLEAELVSGSDKPSDLADPDEMVSASAVSLDAPSMSRSATSAARNPCREHAA